MFAVIGLSGFELLLVLVCGLGLILFLVLRKKP